MSGARRHCPAAVTDTERDMSRELNTAGKEHGIRLRQHRQHRRVPRRVGCVHKRHLEQETHRPSGTQPAAAQGQPFAGSVGGPTRDTPAGRGTTQPGTVGWRCLVLSLSRVPGQSSRPRKGMQPLCSARHCCPAGIQGCWEMLQKCCPHRVASDCALHRGDTGPCRGFCCSGDRLAWGTGCWRRAQRLFLVQPCGSPMSCGVPALKACRCSRQPSGAVRDDVGFISPHPVTPL